jgi:hypothetical protein
LALLLTRTPPATAFAAFEASRRERVEAIIQIGRRQAHNNVGASTLRMWILYMIFWAVLKVMSVERMLGRAWRYRVDWEERDVKKVVKWWTKGGLINA